MRRIKLPLELLLPIFVVAILAAMICPLPTWLLDTGLALNLAAAASLLVAALTVRDALAVTSFPTLLLVTTLLRLALNVSSTRLALAEGHAGQVIQAFGEFVVRGDYVVGAVIFAILTLVQFLVVAKGAERVAEVSARFTLDAMPGKQMSIDADLRAGAIDQAQARARRRLLERESQMFGAMDGAMKFVKGDVIAGLVIVLVNLVGGILVGVFQHGLELSEAASTYALIAVGDGLVSQIPSLCIAIAAGLVVTRVASDQPNSSLGAEIGRQFFGQPKALYVVGGLCLALALLPGMPGLIFCALAGALVGGGILLQRKAEQDAQALDSGAGSGFGSVMAAGAPGEPAGPGNRSEGAAEASSVMAALTLDFAADLTAWVQSDGMRLLKTDLPLLREQLYHELGVRLPGVRVRTGVTSMPAGSYQILVEEIPAGGGAVDPERLHVAARPEELTFLGIVAEPDTDPMTGQPISKVPLDVRVQLESAQLQVRGARDRLLAHLASVLRLQAARLLGVQDVQALLDGFEPSAPVLVRAAIEKVPLPLLTDVLRKLVEEEVSIRNLRAILECLVSPTTEGDATQLAERSRQSLQRYFSHKYAPSGILYVHLVDPLIEESLRGGRGSVDPSRVTGILEGLHKISANGRAVLLTAPDIRRPLRKLCEGSFPNVAVLTYADLSPDQQIRPIGKLALAA